MIKQHLLWLAGTQAERTAYDTAPLQPPVLWYETDTAAWYFWTGAAWAALGGGGGGASALAALFPEARMICNFDGSKPYPTDFYGSFLTHLGQSPAMVSGSIFRPGKYGKALQVGEGTVNSVYNPDLSGTYASGLAPGLTETDPGSTLTVGANEDDAFIEVGQYSQKLVFAAGSNAYVAFSKTNPLAYNTWYTWFARLYVVSGTLVVKAWTGTGYHTASFSTPGWHSFVYTAQTASSSSEWQWPFIVTNDGNPAEGYLDQAALEQKQYRTPLAVGDMPGHAFQGADRSAASQRLKDSAVRYEFPYLQGKIQAVTVMGWVKATGTAPGQYGYLFAGESINGTSNMLAADDVGYVAGQRNRFRFRVYYTTYYGQDGSLPPDTWVHVALQTEGESGQARLVVNGAVDTEISYGYHFGWGDRLSIAASPPRFNGFVDDLVVVDRYLSLDEIQAYLESEAPPSAPAVPQAQALYWPLVTSPVTLDVTSWTEISSQASRVALSRAWLPWSVQLEVVWRQESGFGHAYLRLMQQRGSSPLQVLQMDTLSSTVDLCRSTLFSLPHTDSVYSEDEYYLEVRNTQSGAKVHIVKAGLVMIPGGGKTSF